MRRIAEGVSDYLRIAEHPARNGPIWYERSTNMRRHEDWILVGVTAVFRQQSRRVETSLTSRALIRLWQKWYPPRMQDQGAPVATAPVVRRLPIDRWFYVGMPICAIISQCLGICTFPRQNRRAKHKFNKENIQ
jgi:hypothetical protein